jgi:hypothetical protein
MQGVKDRAKKAGEVARAGEPPVPDLAQAHAQFDAQKDGPMTLGEIGRAQRTQAQVADAKQVFKPETLAGLAEIKKMADDEKDKQDTAATASNEAKEKEESEEAPMSPDEALAATEAMSELDIEMLLARMNQDIIQNKEEQEAIAKKVDPIDFAEGIMRGEFTQVVPVREGLRITYRSLTPFENEEIRRMILKRQVEEPRTASLAAERLSFMQTIAAIVMINGNEMPRHLTKIKSGWEFDEDVFNKKYNLFASYPTSFIHTLTTHAYWFDLRVRELFTVEKAKNS